MSVTTANGVSATLVQPAIYRGAVAPTSASVGDLWEDISTSPPVLKHCSVAPSTWVAVSTGGGGSGNVPTGGTAGQILSKIDATDYNTQWIDNYATQLKFQAKNTTGSTLAKGTVVYVSGASGANPFMAPALATSDATSATTVGFLESTTVNNGFGLVVESGTISGINTSAATEGDPVWLSGTTAGGVIYGFANKPKAPIHLVYLGTVTRAHAINGEIQVKVSNGWELDELHDVQITNPLNNQVLQWESSTNLWKNKTFSVGSVTGTLAASNGGTGQSSYAVGDLLYATASNTLSPLTVGANTYMMVSNGFTPTWVSPSTVTVGIANVSINSTNTYNLIGGAANRIPYQSGSGVTTFLAAPSTANTFLGYDGSALGWTNTLTNSTITNYTETLYAPSAGSAFTIDLANGTVQKITSNANLTITLPASSAGKSYVIMVSYGGAHTLTWAGGSTIKWAGGTAPTATSTSGKVDVFTFFCDGTNTYGQSFGLNY
jgi:hypothetical protein